LGLNTPLPPSRRILNLSSTRAAMLGAAIAIVLVIAWRSHALSKAAANDHASARPAVRVDTAAAKRVDVPIYLGGLGTVQAYYTVTITARVDGQLQKIGFVEGETLKKGALIAQIDPRPYQAALDQALAVKAKDSAQLQSAQQDLQRYVMLAPEELTSKQTLDAQRALVAELRAQIKGDEATIENARTQLAYTTITAPIEGRTGIRLVDPGNNVHASDTTGIVVLTQVQPISFIFTLPEDELPAVSRALAAGPVAVAALSRDEKTEFDHGTLALIDNQIDQTTGTARLKATFPNAANQLWPGEFINARVLVETTRNALTIPSKAVQRGPNGVFTYVVKPDATVEVRALQIGAESGALTVVAKGINDGETVVTSNQYRLQPGTPVRTGESAGTAIRSAASGKAPPLAAGAGLQ
jgi:membrane fusion protein, multidrug efflux system